MESIAVVEDSIQVGIGNGRQVTFGLREYGVEVIEQQRFVRCDSLIPLGNHAL